MSISAYYSHNKSYSRSYNAECAEKEGRLPRTRAAAYFGLSVKAFDAGCNEANYYTSEWHHVGKYANKVDYYDCDELKNNPDFWLGIANAYKSPAKKAAFMTIFNQRKVEQKKERINDFTNQLIKNRDCTIPVHRHNGNTNWTKRCLAAGITKRTIPVYGNEESFKKSVDWIKRCAAAGITKKIPNIGNEEKLDWIKRCLAAGIPEKYCLVIGIPENYIPGVGNEEKIDWIKQCLAIGISEIYVPKISNKQDFQDTADLLFIMKQYFTLIKNDTNRKEWLCGNTKVVFHRHRISKNFKINIGPIYQPDNSNKPEGTFGLNISIKKAISVLHKILKHNNSFDY